MSLTWGCLLEINCLVHVPGSTWENSAARTCYQLEANLYPSFYKNHYTELMAEIWSTNFCSSPSCLFFFFSLQKEVEESSRLYMLSLVTSISFWNPCVCVSHLPVANWSCWGAEIPFSMSWLSEALLTLCMSKESVQCLWPCTKRKTWMLGVISSLWCSVGCVWCAQAPR